ncbi:MAG: helix-turn-helix transcriptional regulator [Desulfobacteraceae bacterium]|nr:helix-turn-helix transcriptional regulator [Desulfobacteraceae bacterium]
MKDSWWSYLSKDNLVHLLEIVNGCIDCVDLDYLTDLLYKLKNIAQFDTAVCTYAQPRLVPALIDKYMYPLNYQCPDKIMDIWRYDRCYRIDVSVQVILSSLNLKKNYDANYNNNDDCLTITVQELPDNFSSNGLIYGAYEKCCNRWILLVFTCRKNFNEPISNITIELAVPHLFRAYRNLKYLSRSQPFHLTKREFEILNWIKMGKTTWEIAQILDVSESCVNFHIDNLKKKFDVGSRTQVVAIALSNGLIKI